MAHAQRLLKWGQVHEHVTWLCARYLADRSTSIQNIIENVTLDV